MFFRTSTDAQSAIYMVVDVTLGTTLTRSQPRVLFESQEFTRSVPTRSYDISPNEQQFLMTSSRYEQQPVTSIHIVQNWLEELSRLVPADP